MREYKKKGYKYLVMLDDDITPMTNSIVNLIREAENHPEYHAIAGWIRDWGDRKRFIGGKIKNDTHYYYYPVVNRTMEADYISSGFTIHRLNKIIPYSKDWEMGWADWDWSHEVKKAELRLAVTGSAGAYHRHVLTKNGMEFTKDPQEYQTKRRDKQRHDRMASRFTDKWGYWPTAPKPIGEMPR